MNRFVYFDVGGVLLKDFSGNDGWKTLKKAIGLTEQTEAAFDAFWDENTQKVCTSLDVDDLLPRLKDEFGVTIGEGSSLLKAFVDRFERLDFMQGVCDTIVSHYDSGLLTNMYPRMFGEIKRQGKLPNCQWKVIVDSSLVGMAKPEERIYRFAEKQCGRSPRDILFVDNTRGHLEAAKSLGWQTFWFDPKCAEDSAKLLLKELGLLD